MSTIKEGYMYKGGHNEKPSTPRPKNSPKGQNAEEINTKDFIKYERDEYRRMLIEIRIMAANAKPMQIDIIDFIDEAFCGNDDEEEDNQINH